MSKLQDLNDAVTKIDTNDYNRAIIALGGKPVSQISYLKDYKPKREEVENQIRKAKKDVGSVNASLVSLDKKLEYAQSSVNAIIKELDTQIVPSDTMLNVKKNLKKVQRSISIIRANIAVFKKKLSELGYTIG